MQQLSENFLHLQTLSVAYRSVNALVCHRSNPRIHTKKQIQQIANSIHAFGFTNPILIDASQNIIAGHGRIEAAKLLGIDQVPTIELQHLNEAQRRAYVIADNKLAENAGWDQDLLAKEFKYIMELDVNFDLAITGFEMPEVDFLMQSNIAIKDDEAPPPPPSNVPISNFEDLWLLGEHKLLCGNALQQAAYQSLLDNEKADMIFTDPPYNVPVDGHICGHGTVKHEEFIMAAGEMSQKQFTDFLSQTFSNLVSFSRNGSIHFICMDWRHVAEIVTAGSLYAEYKNLCVWNKTNGGMGSLYRSKHELIFVFKNGTAPHINNIELGKHGRYRTNVWDYPGVNTFHKDRKDELMMHPTVKPIRMIKDAILDCSKRGDLILDCFGGSGSTLLAADASGRRARLIELDPRYVDVAIERYQKATGVEAVHALTGDPFNTLKARKEVKNVG